jgi:hypothetical protein
MLPYIYYFIWFPIFINQFIHIINYVRYLYPFSLNSLYTLSLNSLYTPCYVMLCYWGITPSRYGPSGPPMALWELLRHVMEIRQMVLR